MRLIVNMYEQQLCKTHSAMAFMWIILTESYPKLYEIGSHTYFTSKEIEAQKS